MPDAPAREPQRHVKGTTGGRGFLGIDEIALKSGKLLDDERVATGFDRMRLCSAWRRAVGPALARASRPDSMRGARLIVEVKDDAWKRELERLEPLILPRLARLIGGWGGTPVERVTFHVVLGMKPLVARGRAASVAVGGDGKNGRSGNSLFDPAAADLPGRFNAVMRRYLGEEH